jgi:hypothetical protein
MNNDEAFGLITTSSVRLLTELECVDLEAWAVAEFNREVQGDRASQGLLIKWLSTFMTETRNTVNFKSNLKMLLSHGVIVLIIRMKCRDLKNSRSQA